MAFLASCGAAILSFLLKLWQGRGQPAPVQEGERAGADSQALQQEVSSNAEVAKASAASDAVAPVLADPGKLRQFESTDPNNRDNA